ncbi:MAG: hypothetical protein ACO1O6_10210 [Bacteroidota bacterium]
MILSGETRWPVGEETYQVMPAFGEESLIIIGVTLAMALLIVYLTRDK